MQLYLTTIALPIKPWQLWQNYIAHFVTILLPSPPFFFVLIGTNVGRTG